MPFKPLQTQTTQTSSFKPVQQQTQSNFVVPKVGPAVDLKATAQESGASKTGSLEAEAAKKMETANKITKGFDNFLNSGKSAFDLTPQDLLKLNIPLDDAKELKQYIDLFNPNKGQSSIEAKAQGAANTINILAKYARKIPASTGPSSYITDAGNYVMSKARLNPYKSRFDNLLQSVAPMFRNIYESGGRFTEQDILSAIKDIGDIGSGDLKQRVLSATDLGKRLTEISGKEYEFDPVGYDKLTKQQLEEIMKLVAPLE